MAAGLAWAALPADQVESHCLELAANVAASPLLARRAARSFRLEVGPPALAWEAALQLEQPVQMWSFRNGPMAQ